MNASDQTEKLLSQIREAFQEVELGEGVSLHQALVIDCYGSDEEQQEARAKDEQHNWQMMLALPQLHSTLSNAISFFDASGARFHLPVCLSLIAVNPEAHFSLSHILEPCHYEAHQLLNEAQRQCVRDVLQIALSRLPDRSFPYFSSDLESYWDANATDDDRKSHHLQELKNLGFLVTHTEVTYTIERIDGGMPQS